MTKAGTTPRNVVFTRRNRLPEAVGMGLRLALLLVCCGLSSPCVAVEVTPYDYPFTDPLEATVIGTPEGYRADLPEDVPVQIRQVQPFPHRHVPDIFWYCEDAALRALGPVRPGAAGLHHPRHRRGHRVEQDRDPAAHPLRRGPPRGLAALADPPEFHRQRVRLAAPRPARRRRARSLPGHDPDPPSARKTSFRSPVTISPATASAPPTRRSSPRSTTSAAPSPSTRCC